MTKFFARAAVIIVTATLSLGVTAGTANAKDIAWGKSVTASSTK